MRPSDTIVAALENLKIKHLKEINKSRLKPGSHIVASIDTLGLRYFF